MQSLSEVPTEFLTSDTKFVAAQETFSSNSYLQQNILQSYTTRMFQIHNDSNHPIRHIHLESCSEETIIADCCCCAVGGRCHNLCWQHQRSRTRNHFRCQPLIPACCDILSSGLKNIFATLPKIIATYKFAMTKNSPLTSSSFGDSLIQLRNFSKAW